MLRMLFGARAPAKPLKSVLPPERESLLTIEDNSPNATRRQLVQVLLRDVLRRHGIPFQWIECQVQAVASRSRGPGVTVRLIVKHWDERLMNFSYALQNVLVADITRFEPQAPEWLHGISWQLEVAESCPYLTLPEKAFWLEPARPAASTAPITKPSRAHITPIPAMAPAPAPSAASIGLAAGPATSVAPTAEAGLQDEALQDLERLFLIRDQALGTPPASVQEPVHYLTTQPSPL